MANETARDWHLSERSEGQQLTRVEFARLARVHPDTVKRWTRLGIGPRPRKLGPRLLRYDRGEVLAFLSIAEGQESAG